MCHKGQSIMHGKDFVRNDLSDVARRQIRPIFPYLKKAMLFGDGEPMIYKYFWDIVKEIRELSTNCTIDFINNGSMMYGQNIENVFSHQVSHIGLSIGGATEKTHNYCRPPGMFDKIIQNYDILNKEKIKRKTHEPYITMLMVVMKSNYKEIPELIGLAYNLGIYQVELQKLFITDPIVSNEVVSDEEIKPYLYQASKLAKLHGVGLIHYPIDCGNYNVSPLRFSLQDRAFSHSLHLENIPGYCKFQQPWNTVYVLHNAQVVPDCHWWSSSVNTEMNHCGTLDEQTNILDIWNGPIYNKIRQSIMNGQILSQCRGCGLAGGIKDEFRGPDTDQDNPQQESQYVKLNIKNKMLKLCENDTKSIISEISI